MQTPAPPHMHTRVFAARRLKCTRPSPSRVRHFQGLLPLATRLCPALLAAALATLPAHAACPPQCAVAASVVNAAGVPDPVATATGRLRFDGAGLSRPSAAAVKDLAAALKRMPAQATVTLKIAADTGLAAPAAASQLAARQRALSQALQAEGVEAGRVRLVAGP